MQTHVFEAFKDYLNRYIDLVIAAKPETDTARLVPQLNLCISLTKPLHITDSTSAYLSLNLSIPLTKPLHTDAGRLAAIRERQLAYLK